MYENEHICCMDLDLGFVYLYIMISYGFLYVEKVTWKLQCILELCLFAKSRSRVDPMLR